MASAESAMADTQHKAALEDLLRLQAPPHGSKWNEQELQLALEGLEILVHHRLVTADVLQGCTESQLTGLKPSPLPLGVAKILKKAFPEPSSSADRLTLQQFLAHPVPLLPPGGASSASESDRWLQHPSRLELLEPEFTQQLDAIFQEAANSTEATFRPVEFRGNLIDHAADSEGGVAAYFIQTAQAADDMPKAQGLTGISHVSLATAAVLQSVGPEQLQRQPSDLFTALGQLAVESGAAAAAWAACRAIADAAGAGTSAAAATTNPPASTAAAAAAAVPALSRSARQSGSSSGVSRHKLDMVVLLSPEQASRLGAQRYVVAFGELKVRSKLMTADGQPKDLVALYQTGDPVVYPMMGQLLTYMNALKVSHGYISCHDWTWLVLRKAPDWDILYTSHPISAAASGPGPTMMKAFAWVYKYGLQAVCSSAPVELMPSRYGNNSGGGRDTGSGSGSGSGSGNQGHDPYGKPSRGRGDGKRVVRGIGWDSDFVSYQQLRSKEHSSSGRQDSMPSLDQLATQPAFSSTAQLLAAADVMGVCSSKWFAAVLRALPVFPQAWLAQGTRLGAGGTAVVYSCSFGALQAAVKVMWVEQLRALLREAAAYGRLRQLQGQVIPQLLALGLIEGGALCFLAATVVAGTPLDKLRVTPAIANAACVALQQLHDQGVMHGDLALQNLLACITADGGTTVMLVDLAKVRSAQPAECAAEMGDLKRALKGMAAT